MVRRARRISRLVLARYDCTTASPSRGVKSRRNPMERNELSPVVVYTLSVPTSVPTSVEQSFWARFRSRSTRFAHSEETLCSTYLGRGTMGGC